MKCSFCGNNYSSGTGLTFVKREGQVYHFCSRKCEKNLLKLKRNPRKFKWTQYYGKQRIEEAEKAKETKLTKAALKKVK